MEKTSRRFRWPEGVSLAVLGKLCGQGGGTAWPWHRARGPAAEPTGVESGGVCAVVPPPSPTGRVAPAVPQQSHKAKHVTWHLEAGLPLQNGAANHLYLRVTMKVWGRGERHGVPCSANGRTQLTVTRQQAPLGSDPPGAPLPHSVARALGDKVLPSPGHCDACPSPPPRTVVPTPTTHLGPHTWPLLSVSALSSPFSLRSHVLSPLCCVMSSTLVPWKWRDKGGLD